MLTSQKTSSGSGSAPSCWNINLLTANMPNSAAIFTLQSKHLDVPFQVVVMTECCWLSHLQAPRAPCVNPAGGAGTPNLRAGRAEWQEHHNVSFTVADEETQELLLLLLLLLPAKRSATDAAVGSCAASSGVHVGVSQNIHHYYGFRPQFVKPINPVFAGSLVFSLLFRNSIFTHTPPSPTELSAALCVKACSVVSQRRPRRRRRGGGRGTPRDAQAGAREKARPNQTTAGPHRSVSSQNSCEQRAD